MEIIIANDIERVRQLVKQGYCPVECSFGSESVTDDLVMDHHNTLAHMESVAVRAYRDHFGARKNDPRFVGTGVADADMTFAIAALAGILPHPDQSVSALPPRVAAVKTRGWMPLAQTIAQVDTNPIGLSVPDLDCGDYLLLWKALSDQARTSQDALFAVLLWSRLLEGDTNKIKHLLGSSGNIEAGRIKKASEEMERTSKFFGPSDCVMALDGTKVWGFDVWYSLRGGPASDPASWQHPVVLMLGVHGGSITVGCPNDEVAAKLFGPKGLGEVFPKIGEGWGGRGTIGGSPRGQEMTTEDLHRAAEILAKALIL